MTKAIEELRRARVRRWLLFTGLLGLIALACLAGAGVGPMPVNPLDLVLGHGDAVTRTVVGEIRLPRVALGLLVGAALAASGAAMQGLFRNPLADPGLVGVSAGAACGAVSAIVLGHGLRAPDWAMPWLLPATAFAGSLATMATIHRLSMHEGQPAVATMLLCGIAINALAGALTAFLVFLANDQQARDVTFWLMGSLGAATWAKVAVIAAGVLPGLVCLPAAARALDALLLGEAEAGHLGHDVGRVKTQVVLIVTLMVGLAVAFTGVIGFVGLIVPHALRLVAGPGHRFLLPASALMGGALLVLADLAARCVVAPAELPIGILTALLGAPFFLWLLLRAKTAWQP
jgi:iron complex transport system permease protein